MPQLILRQELKCYLGKFLGNLSYQGDKRVLMESVKSVNYWLLREYKEERELWILGFDEVSEGLKRW